MSEKIKVLIVDDEPTAREILHNHLSKIAQVEIIDSCKNALDAFSIIKTTNINLLFLDINMPEMNGLALAKILPKNCKVIFTTAYREYAIDGFDLKAVDYLLKPISFERLLQAISKYIDESPVAKISDNFENESNIEDHFFVRANRKMVKIMFSEIEYIESLSDYVKIVLSDQTITTRETISNIEAKLPQKSFIRTHRSFIVSYDKITSYSNEVIELTKKEIPISRSYKMEVLSKLEK